MRRTLKRSALCLFPRGDVWRPSTYWSRRLWGLPRATLGVREYCHTTMPWWPSSQPPQPHTDLSSYRALVTARLPMQEWVDNPCPCQYSTGVERTRVSVDTLGRSPPANSSRLPDRGASVVVALTCLAAGLQGFGNNMDSNAVLSKQPIFTPALKRKCRHFDDLFHHWLHWKFYFDNFHCSQWRKCHQNNDIQVCHFSAWLSSRLVDRGTSVLVALVNAQPSEHKSSVILYCHCGLLPNHPNS